MVCGPILLCKKNTPKCKFLCGLRRQYQGYSREVSYVIGVSLCAINKHQYNVTCFKNLFQILYRSYCSLGRGELLFRELGGDNFQNQLKVGGGGVHFCDGKKWGGGGVKF